jgi:hypothetical protein
LVGVVPFDAGNAVWELERGSDVETLTTKVGELALVTEAWVTDTATAVVETTVSTGLSGGLCN